MRIRLGGGLVGAYGLTDRESVCSVHDTTIAIKLQASPNCDYASDPFVLVKKRMDTAEFQESNSITFEWTLRGLKNLFESRCVRGCHVPCKENLTL